MIERFSNPIEPDASQRAAARELYRFFVALREQGFTDEQALQLVGSMISSIPATDE